MKLDKFLELSEDEKLQESSIMKMFNSNVNDDSELYDYLKELAPEVLFKLALVNPEMDSLCKSIELDEYWNDIWRQCGTNSTEEARINNQPIQEYLPMITVPSCFDLLKGLYLYERYRGLVEDKELSAELIRNAEEYLAASSQLGCYFASNALCENGLLLLHAKFDESLASKIIFHAKTAAGFYLSPGYLLLSKVYQELTLYKDRACFRGQNLVLASAQALEIAKRLEPVSGPMLNNAYQGKSLAQASGGKIKTFFQAQIRFQNLFNLSPSEINIVVAKGKLEANSIIESLKVTGKTELSPASFEPVLPISTLGRAV